MSVSVSVNVNVHVCPCMSMSMDMDVYTSGPNPGSECGVGFWSKKVFFAPSYPRSLIWYISIRVHV